MSLSSKANGSGGGQLFWRSLWTTDAVEGGERVAQNLSTHMRQHSPTFKSFYDSLLGPTTREKEKLQHRNELSHGMFILSQDQLSFMVKPILSPLVKGIAILSQVQLFNKK